mmetsp:Transcript_13293/g.30028  ORF Transcript_13293/g.30028 Transcript_13293/m.30028 type:complete len:181 (+) Transcript_13293:2-544(+)
MRTAMLGEQEKLKQATRELEAAHREVQRARAQHDDAAGGVRPPSLRSISQAKIKGQSFRNLLAARVATPAAASEAKASSEATEEERAPSPPHHHDSAAAVSVPLIQWEEAQNNIAALEMRCRLLAESEHALQQELATLRDEMQRLREPFCEKMNLSPPHITRSKTSGRWQKAAGTRLTRL